MRLRLAIVGVVAFAAGAPACGAPTARPMAAMLAATVSLENKRQAPLLNFEIVMPARDKATETIVGRLGRPLAAGAAASFPLTGASGCTFEARWAFEDVKDSGDVDLCNDARIVLVD